MVRRTRKKSHEKGTLEVRVPVLEIAKGHDGFLRGKPEPVVVAAVYVLNGETPQLLERHIWRFETPASIPGSVTAPAASLRTKRIRWPEQPLVMVCLAIEENSGAGIRELYAALERARELMLLDDQVMHCHHLQELSGEEQIFRRAMPRLDDVGFDEMCPGDRWIDAAWIKLPRGKFACEPRFHAKATDMLNDWTALMEVQRR